MSDTFYAPWDYVFVPDIPRRVSPSGIVCGLVKPRQLCDGAELARAASPASLPIYDEDAQDAHAAKTLELISASRGLV